MSDRDMKMLAALVPMDKYLEVKQAADKEARSVANYVLLACNERMQRQKKAGEVLVDE